MEVANTSLTLTKPSDNRRISYFFLSNTAFFSLSLILSILWISVKTKADLEKLDKFVIAVL
jgi:hypothetical protein